MNLPLKFLLLIWAGWMNRAQQNAIDYLKEENRDLKTRRVEVAGIIQQPYGEWMQQVARNLTDVVDGFLKKIKYLIHDRDPLYTRAFADILASGGVRTVKLPARSPDLNAYAERFGSSFCGARRDKTGEPDACSPR